MDQVLSLWMPVVVSAVIVWIASALAWMVMPHHKKDWKALPDEKGFLEALGRLNISPGVYMFPNCGGHKNAKDPEHVKRWEKGPRGLINLWPSQTGMGGKMASSFVFYLIVGVFVAYLTSLAIPQGTPTTYIKVFRVAGTAAVMAYTLGGIPSAIWFNKGRALFTDLFDGVVYGLLTAGAFGWLWPKAAAAVGAAAAHVGL